MNNFTPVSKAEVAKFIEEMETNSFNITDTARAVIACYKGGDLTKYTTASLISDIVIKQLITLFKISSTYPKKIAAKVLTETIKQALFKEYPSLLTSARIQEITTILFKKEVTNTFLKSYPIPS